MKSNNFQCLSKYNTKRRVCPLNTKPSVLISLGVGGGGGGGVRPLLELIQN